MRKDQGWSMPFQPLVTLIVPMYQAAPYLRPCLDSAQTQTYANIEVLMVDDGSTDDTAAIARSYVERDSRFQLIQQSNQGLSAARNAALDRASGAWIGFLDSDDVLEPDAIHTLLTVALENGTAMSMGAYMECHQGKRMSLRRYVGAHSCVCHTAEETQRYFVTHGQFLFYIWTKLFRRDVFDEVRFPVGRLYEDIFTLPSLIEKAGSCAVVNRMVYRYQVRRGSLSNSINLRKQMDGVEARLAHAEFLRQRYPKLVPYANDAALSFVCGMLGKVEQVGIENAPEEWQELLEITRRLIPEAAMENVVYRAGAGLFKRNPRALSKIVRLGLRVFGSL